MFINWLLAKFHYSTCDSGRWECTDDICSKTCAVLGFQHFETFDGMRYEFHGPPCNYVLVEVGQVEFYGPLYSATYNWKYAKRISCTLLLVDVGEINL